MRPWQAILVILVLFFFAISSGWTVLYKLTYVMVILFILSWLWARYSLRKLAFRRNTSTGRVQVGETFEERLMLDNTSVLPKLWVQGADVFNSGPLTLPVETPLACSAGAYS